MICVPLTTKMTTTFKPASASNIQSICRFCLNPVDGSKEETHWLRWDDCKISTLTVNYELITKNEVCLHNILYLHKFSECYPSNKTYSFSQKLSISTKVSQLCCAECATLINKSAEAVRMFLNAEYFWASFKSTEPYSQPYEDQIKSEELLSNDGSIEVLDSSMKEEGLEDFHYENENDLNLETTVALSITPAGQAIFDGESEEEEDEDQDKSNISFMLHAGPSDDYGVDEYSIT